MLSVITVVKNDIEGLSKTIKSVRSQTGLEIEHLIIDGGSIDGSARLAAENNQKEIPSFQDGGIYQGMQRGLELASGDYILFLNSGDEFLGTTFVRDGFAVLLESEVLWGYGPLVERNLRGSFSYVTEGTNNSLTRIVHRKTFIPFPTVIMSRSLVLQIGGFSYEYQIAGDFDLLVRLAQISEPVTWNVPFAIFSAGGISYTKAPLAWKEEHAIRVERLNLIGLAKIKSYFVYVMRVFKWELGKFLDFPYSIFRINDSKHWREVKKTKVPKKYLEVLTS